MALFKNGQITSLILIPLNPSLHENPDVVMITTLQDYTYIKHICKVSVLISIGVLKI